MWPIIIFYLLSKEFNNENPLKVDETEKLLLNNYK